MTDTEKLLINARDIARRTFANPSEATVIELFQRLCAEQDARDWANDERDRATVH